MTEEKLDIENIKLYWISEAEEALNVSRHLFEKEVTSQKLMVQHSAEPSDNFFQIGQLFEAV